MKTPANIRPARVSSTSNASDLTQYSRYSTTDGIGGLPYPTLSLEYDHTGIQHIGSSYGSSRARNHSRSSRRRPTIGYADLGEVSEETQEVEDHHRY
jgi:hypothetical protein